MTGDAHRPAWRFTLPWWAELDVVARDSVPPVLRPAADLTAPLEDRFRPALLRFARGGEGAYVAVRRRPGPPQDVPHPEDLRGVALGQARTLSCRVCSARVPALYPEAGLPLFGPHLAAHRLVGGCPRCGSGFAASRVQALAVLPPR
ncbi:hypothetical protein E4198_20055 [Streptomyces sp. RKND-216]|uniref:hypothetical protein n=1 Tax=Streptomyces sp. RKND-216 TaxID=2562581 RepID=UPI00109DBF8B|nr:hypothetical protein [Streptomyces sp. RKND-216]THA26656.1 hypothetical protein E4198_20055 [Streptomyces sp. RKND-216]